MTDSPTFAPDPRPVVTREPWSSEFDQVRATVQALQGAATLLQGALEQRQGLWADMRGAEQSLAALQQQRAQAEQALSAAQAQLERASLDVAQVRAEQSGLVAEFDRLVQGALARRGALVAEVADLERRRAELVDSTPRQTVPTPQQVMPTPQPLMPMHAFVPQPVLAQEPLVAQPFVQEPVAVQSFVAAPTVTMVPETPPAPPAPVPVAGRKGVHLPGWRLLATTLLGSVLLGLALLLTPVSQVVGGLQLLAVMSGSMEPTIPVGGIVGVRPVPASQLQVGDIITFANQSSPDVLVTHRVVALELRGAQTLLTTKGDANDTVDAVSTAATRAVGRVEFFAPWLGYVMFWLATPIAKVGILVVSVIGFALPSFKRSPEPAAAQVSSSVHTTESYRALEREIQDLLPRAS